MRITVQDINDQAEAFQNQLDAREDELSEELKGAAPLALMLEGVGVDNAEEIATDVLLRWGPVIGVVTLTGIATGLAFAQREQQVEA